MYLKANFSPYTLYFDYRQAIIRLNRQLAAAHYNLGRLLQQQNASNWEEAIACYRTALEIQPDFLEADVSLANALYAQGKLTPEQQIHYAAVNNDLGIKRQQAGNLKAAIECYHLAADLDPELAEARYNLRLALAEKEDRTIKISCAR